MAYIGIDLSGSHATCALVSGSRIVAKRQITVSDNTLLAAVLPALEDSVHGLLTQAAGDCRGIAFSFCGIVDGIAGRIVETNGKYYDAPGLHLPEWAQERFGLQLRMENDARTALLGEWIAGAACDSDDVLMIILGTGVGGAAMIGGKLLRGKHSQAGCLLGHFVCDRQGRLCTCGNIGCVEAEASTWALDGICREHPEYAASSLARLEHITFKDVFSSANDRDLCTRAIRERCLQVWAVASVSWIHAYDPEVIVFGGGVLAAAEQILPAIATYIDRHAWTPWGKVCLRKAKLGNEASLYAGPALFNQDV